jgi:hypothetical protein
MARGTSRRTAIVADRRPLERGLARFLLEERGLFVVGEAATMADVLLQIQQLKPDVVVLHEKLALDHDPTVIAQIRRVSSRTRLVLLAASREALPPELILLADTVVEDGPGLTELGAAVAGPVPATDATPVAVPVAVPVDAEAPVVPPPTRGSGKRWADRVQGLAVASIILLAFAVARDMTTPSLVPTVVGRAHLVAAWESLDDLESALSNATDEEIAEIASALIDDRAAAEAAGVNVTPLDQALAETLATVWTTLPPETQELLIAIFGEIIFDDDVPPPPVPAPTTEPPPSPQPAPEPSPSPAETTTPPPTETTTPPPTETETTTTTPTETETETTTPPPTETTTPPPTETETPPPTETETPPPTKTKTKTETTTTETTTTETTTTETTTTTTTTPTETTTTPSTETTTTPSTETTTPPATDTTTPPATDTTTPPSTETTTAPPAGEGETQSASLLVVPFALTLLLAISGWARRRAYRTNRDPDESRRS